MAEPERQAALDAVDLTIGTAAAGIFLVAGWTATAARIAAPPARAVLGAGQSAARRLPRPPDRLRDGGEALRDGGHAVRDVVRRAVREAFDALVPRVVDVILDRIDLTELVVDRVDLDRVASNLDVDAVIARADLDAAVARVDLIAVVEYVVDRLDLEALVPRVVDAMLAQIDLTEFVIDHVDLNRVAAGLDVDAVVARADLDAAVARVDLLGLADYVIEGVDLPKIIRDSTGSVASEGIREVRLQSFEADQTLAQFVDRLLLRRGSRRDGRPALADGDSGADGAHP